MDLGFRGVMLTAMLTRSRLLAEVVTVQVDDLLLTLRALLPLCLVLPFVVLVFEPVPMAFLHLQILLFLVDVTLIERGSFGKPDLKGTRWRAQV